MAQEEKSRGASAFRFLGAGLMPDKPLYKVCRTACKVPMGPPWGVGRLLSWAWPRVQVSPTGPPGFGPGHPASVLVEGSGFSSSGRVQDVI